MNALIKTGSSKQVKTVYQFSHTSSNVELKTFSASTFDDDIDSFFKEFESVEGFQDGMVKAGSFLADALYGAESFSLKSLRLKKGYTQKDLCKLTGLLQPALARLESNENQDPKLSTLEKLSEALNEPIDVIIKAFKN